MRKDFYIKHVNIDNIKKELFDSYIRTMPDDIDIHIEEDYLIWQYYYNVNYIVYEMIREDIIELNYLIDMIIHLHKNCVKMADIMDEDRYNDYMDELDIRIGMYFQIAYENEMYETMENFKKFNDLYLNVDNFSIEWLEGEKSD